MHEFSRSNDPEDYLEMAQAIETVSSLPDDDKYHDFLNEHLLDRTATWTLGAEPAIALEPLSQYFKSRVSVIEQAQVSVFTSPADKALVEGSLTINGEEYSIVRHELSDYHSLHGDKLTLGDEHLNAALLSIARYYIDEKGDAIEEMMDGYSDGRSPQERLAKILLGLGGIAGESKLITRAGVLNHDDKVLIARLTEVEAPHESSRSNEIESAKFVHEITVEDGIRLSNTNLRPDLAEIGSRTVSDVDIPLFSIIALGRSTILNREGEVNYFDPSKSPFEARSYATLCAEFLNLYDRL